jgi:hypothetical protein
MWKRSSRNSVWPSFLDLHRLYVWGVRILLTSYMYYAVSCPAGMHKPGQKCPELLEKTGNELSSGVVALMLLAVQKDILELSINQAIRWQASGL